MILTSLTLQNFRSYKKQSFSFSPQTTVVVGVNTAGKTNLLEAMYLLASSKSFRADSDREMIGYKEELARVQARIQNKKGEIINLEVVITTGQVGGEKAPYKKFLVDNTPKRMVDFVGQLRAVVFWPQDLELITSSPSRRRKYLDGILSQVDREYRRTLHSYEKGLRSRNRVLERIREGEANRRELLFWDQLLIKQGNYLTNAREEFITFINDEQHTIDGQIMQVVYDHSVISAARLEQYKEEEAGAAMTLVGPHRDDFGVRIKEDKEDPSTSLKTSKRDKRDGEENGRDLHTYGSRGEQRLAVLWLKLSELDFIKKKTDSRPVLLLDDIFSELDHQHRKFVLDIIPHQQTIITTTDIHLVEGDKKTMHIVGLEKA